MPVMTRGFIDSMYRVTWDLLGAENDPVKRDAMRSNLEQAIRRSVSLTGAALEEPWAPSIRGMDVKEGMVVCRMTRR